MKHKRPVNLNLFTIHFPIPAIVSILHRISGVILFLCIPLLLCGLNCSLTSQQDYDNLHQFLTLPLSKFVIWLLLAAFVYHFVAGIRHLFMDLSLGVELRSGTLAAKLVLIVSLFLIALLGYWLW